MVVVVKRAAAVMSLGPCLGLALAGCALRPAPRRSEGGRVGASRGVEVSQGRVEVTQAEAPGVMSGRGCGGLWHAAPRVEGEAVVDLAFELSHACAVSASGVLRCAGENHLGELGSRGRGVTFRAGVALAEDVTAVRVGRRLTCALTRDRRALCWGALDGIVPEATQPFVLAEADAVGLSVGAGVACVRLASGRAQCAGRGVDALGVLRDDLVGLSVEAMPEAVFWTRDGSLLVGRGRVAFAGAVDVAVGSLHACARTQSGDVGCWGDNGRGQLGSRLEPATPRTVLAAEVGCVTGLAMGSDHGCAVRSDGTVWCWGDNALGQLGDGTRRGRSRPEPVRGIAGALRVFAGPGVSCAALVDGALWCWGAALWLPGELPARLEQPTRVSWS